MEWRKDGVQSSTSAIHNLHSWWSLPSTCTGGVVFYAYWPILHINIYSSDIIQDMCVYNYSYFPQLSKYPSIYDLLEPASLS